MQIYTLYRFDIFASRTVWLQFLIYVMETIFLNKEKKVLISNDCLFLNARLLQDFLSNLVCCKQGWSKIVAGLFQDYCEIFASLLCLNSGLLQDCCNCNSGLFQDYCEIVACFLCLDYRIVGRLL